MTETVEQMVLCVDEVLEDRDQSIEVVRNILNNFGGMQLYLPCSRNAFREEDEAAIYDLYDGNNDRAIIQKYGITFNTLYVILRREGARRAGALKPPLNPEKEKAPKSPARELPWE